MTTFTPLSKENLIGVMLARCDGNQLGEVVVLMLSKQEFRKCLQDNFEMAMTMLRCAVQRLREADRKIGRLALMDVYGRVARLLRRLQCDSQTGLRVPRLGGSHSDGGVEATGAAEPRDAGAGSRAVARRVVRSRRSAGRVVGKFAATQR